MPFLESSQPTIQTDPFIINQIMSLREDAEVGARPQDSPPSDALRGLANGHGLISGTSEHGILHGHGVICRCASVKGLEVGTLSRIIGWAPSVTTGVRKWTEYHDTSLRTHRPASATPDPLPGSSY